MPLLRILSIFLIYKQRKARYSYIKEKEILSVEEAAFYLGTDTGTLLEEVTSGRLPGGQIGKEWFFSKWALLCHLSSYQNMPPEDE
jgi:excisionase family DNA binding protein